MNRPAPGLSTLRRIADRKHRSLPGRSIPPKPLPAKFKVMKLDATNLDYPLAHFQRLSDGTLIAALALVHLLWLVCWLLGAPAYEVYRGFVRVLTESLRRSGYRRVLPFRELKCQHLT